MIHLDLNNFQWRNPVSGGKTILIFKTCLKVENGEKRCVYMHINIQKMSFTLDEVLAGIKHLHETTSKHFIPGTCLDRDCFSILKEFSC